MLSANVQSYGEIDALKMPDTIGNFSRNAMAESNDTVETSVTKSASRKKKIYAAVFLSTVASLSAFAGFAKAVAITRKRDPKHFGDGIAGVKGVHENGALLAIRALGWGTFYAITGCSLFFYGIWKISGATNAEEFRIKMGSLLPKIPKNNPPKSRTEFEGLTDLLTYISEEWGKKNK
ncbi:LOW QUALITY PROTEIN: transmembrane protein 242 [Monomorium pharaonis]|uniref:LOW QUALITY PROTEIN: transmembrane protein 242 n=1 Tax=Monomorium pharaonis TaxID=307658 RepID=UPI00102E14C6|nr:LOW QUALITY PROTEIN: transmembrane protein 242 [Monomorium pharaonis]